jgi:tRNA threonylcarbamoyladenosine biosynthesis protein TsaE
VTTRHLQLPDVLATRRLGAVLARACGLPSIIYLSGDLGAGKTTLAQSFLAAFGYVGRVRSPTYTLVESYPLVRCVVNHFDLYRLGDPEELEFLGIRDYLSPHAIWLVEWPERGRGVLPAADLEIELEHHESGRRAQVQALDFDGYGLRDESPVRTRPRPSVSP